MDKKDYASDSDQSDEDFNPEKLAESEKSASEEEEESISESEVQAEQKRSRTKQAAKNTKTRLKRQKKSTNKISDSEDEEQTDSNNVSRRSTRQTDVTGNSSKITEKDELESDEEEKSRTDSLWASFLSDVKVPAKKAPTETTSKNTVKESPEALTQSNNTKREEKPLKTTVKEIFDFAGEQVEVEKLVAVDSVKENQLDKKTTPLRAQVSGFKRACPSTLTSGGGLGSVLNSIGKKKKISVLEKSQLDWKSFKQDEGIDEEIQTHNKGKDGYLERMDFLQRTDLRQFEIEKGLRQSRRTQ